MSTKWRWILWLGILTATVVAAIYPVEPPSAPAKKRTPSRATSIPTAIAASATNSGTPANRATPPPMHLPELGHDPFDPVAWDTPPPPPPAPPVVVQTAVVEPPVPTEPPLPYQYQGSMKEENGSTVIFLSKGQEGIVAHVGDALDPNYKLVSIDESKLTILYVPMGHNHDIALDRH